MRKRPLCVLCCCFILMTVLLTVSGLPVPWQKKMPSELSQMIIKGTEGRLYGQLYRIQKNSTGCTLYLKNSILVVRSNQYSLQNSTISYDKPINICVGNSVCALGKVSLPKKATNQGQFDAFAYYRIRHVDIQMKASQVTVTDHTVSWLPELARRLRENMAEQFDRALSERESGIMKTMLLGDKSDLDDEVRWLYQKNGISHILDFSGIHISLLGMGLYRLLRKVMGISKASALSCGFLLFYLLLTGFSVSAQRAVFMFWLRRGAECAGRTCDEPTALSLSALVVLCENPLYIFDSSFLLSFGAAFFLWVLKLLKVEKRTFSLYFWLCMLPFTACFYYEVSFVGILLNILILPPLGAILFLGLAGGVTGMTAPLAGKVLLYPVGLLLRLYTKLCQLMKYLPCGSLLVGRPPNWQLLLYGMGLSGLLYLQCKYKKGRWVALSRGVFGGMLVLLLILRLPSSLTVTMLDVGQGDCLVIQKGSSAVLVDGGSTTVSKAGQYRIVPFLRYRGIRKISSIILTHPDADHMNGLSEILKMSETGELSSRIEGITVPYWMRNSQAWEELRNIADQQNIPVTYAKKGDEFTFGLSAIYVLHPDTEDYEENANAGSLTFLLKTEGLSMLFTGDLEGEGETQICRENIRCDVLKVAHHGSAYSTSEELLKKARPSVALISSGAGNSYGHPHKETVERLKQAGSVLFNTMESGQITLEIKKEGILVHEYSGKDNFL